MTFIAFKPGHLLLVAGLSVAASAARADSATWQSRLAPMPPPAAALPDTTEVSGAWSARARAANGETVDFLLQVSRDRRLDGPSAAWGYVAALAPVVGYGPLDGQCLLDRCMLGTTLTDGGLLVLTLDFAGAQPTGHFTLAVDAYHYPSTEGPVDILGPGPALVTASLEDHEKVLALAGFPLAAHNEYLAEAIAAWQTSAGLHPTGLLTPEQAKTLDDMSKTAAAAAGWTDLADPKRGTVFTYPAKRLSAVKDIPGGRRYATPAGDVAAELTEDKALSPEAWNALYETLSTPEAGMVTSSITMNDMALSLDEVFEHRLRRTTILNLPDGLVKLVVTVPDAQQAWLLSVIRIAQP